MMILAIDTSSVAAGAAVLDGNKLIGEIFTDFKLKHCEKIMMMTDDLLKNLHMSIKDIDVFAVGEGPGSFTGLRIGAATVKGFAQAGDKPIAAVSSLRACTYTHRDFGGAVCAVFDAQRDQLYAGIYRYGAVENTVMPDRVIAAGELKDSILALNEHVLMCGDGLYKYRQLFSSADCGLIHFADDILLMPRAAAVGALAEFEIKAGRLKNYADFMPVYIRASQAEVNFRVKL